MYGPARLAANHRRRVQRRRARLANPAARIPSTAVVTAVVTDPVPPSEKESSPS